MNKDTIIEIIKQAATKWQIDPKLAVAIAAHESSFNPLAVANVGGDALRGGSYGLMQMSMATARGLGYKGTSSGLLDPTTNANWGCMLLHQLCRRKGYTMEDVICAYNSGKPKATAPSSTLESYLPAVMNLYGTQQAVTPAGLPANSDL